MRRNTFGRFARHCTIALLLLALHYNLRATPACPIVTGAFQGLANGTTVDNSSIGWSINTVSGAVYFAVQSNRLKAEDLGGIGVWTSKVFSVAGYSSFQVAVKITAEGDQNSSEYVKIYYKIDGGSEVLMNQGTGNFGTIDFTSDVLTGNNVQLIVRIYNYNNGGTQTSKYYIEQYRVFKEAAPCAGTISVSATSSNSGVITCSVPSVTLSASSTASGVTYSWTGPNSFTSTSQNPVVSTAGTYTVVGTNSTGSGSASVTVTANNSAPALTATGGTISCGSSVTLTASSTVSGVTYSWTGPNSFTSTSQNPVVSTAGTYTVTITNPANGCTASQSVTVTSSGTATSSSFWLEDFTLTTGATSDTGTTSWTSSTTGSGTFSVQSNTFKASFASGNTAEGVWTSGVVDISARTSVTVSVDLKSETASSGDALETTDYINVYYKLNGGAETLIFGDVAGLNGTTTGTSTATVTSSSLNGSTLQIVIRVKNSDPTERYYFDNVNIVGVPASVILTPSLTGSVTCTTSAQISLAASGTVSSYAWTGPNGFTSTAQNPTVTAGGTYTVVATLPSGCTVSTSIVVPENKTAPDVTATGGSLSCATSFTLNVSSSVSGVTYSWTGPNSFTSTSKNPTVSTAGTYTVTVTNPANGCTASQSVVVTAPTATTVWLEDFALTDGTTSDTGTTSWSIQNTSSGTFAVTSSEFRVNNIGTSTEGVWTSAAVSISGYTSVSLLADVRSAGSLESSGTSLDYLRFYYKLNGGSEVLFNEQLGSINSNSTTNTSISIAALSGSTIQIVVRGRTTSSDEFYYFDNIKVAGFTQSNVDASASVGGVLTCSTTSVVVSGSSTVSGVTYSWTGPSSFTASTQNITVSTPGNYVLTVANAGGCTASTVANVTQNVVGPGATASVSGSLTCSVTSVTLTGSSSTSGVSYSWAGPSGYTSVLQNPVVTAAGTYTLTVTNPASGCSSTASVTVSQSTTQPGASASASGTLTCASGSTVTLTGSSTTSGVTYSWSGPGTIGSPTSATTTVNTTGTYTLTVTNPSNGCSSTATVTVNPTAASASTLWLEDFALTDGTTSDTGTTSWSIQNTSSGTFAVTSSEFKVNNIGTSTEGVWTSAAIDISDKTNVSISADVRSGVSSGGALESSGSSLDYVRFYYKLNGGTEVLFNEQLGAINSTTNTSVSIGSLSGSNIQIVVRARTTTSDEFYYFDNIKVSGVPSPVGTISTSVSGTLSCTTPTVQLSESVTTSGATYSWITPSGSTLSGQTVTVNVPGNYTAVAQVGSCQGTKIVTVPGSVTPPDISIIGADLSCTTTTTALLTTYSTVSGLTYSWAGPGGVTASTSSISASVAGTYTVSVSNPVNNCSNSASFVVGYTDGTSTPVWTEDFSGLVDGTSSDAGSTAWSVDISKIHTVDISSYSGESGTPYYFEVRSNVLTAKTTLGEVVWTSQPINISTYNQVFVKMDISGAGSLNDLTDCGSNCFDYDYVKISYKLNGGPETPFTTNGSFPGKLALDSISASTGLLSGSTVQIIIRAYNTGNSEFYYFDNIMVSTVATASVNLTASTSGKVTCTTPATLTASPTVSGATYTWTGPSGFTATGQSISVSAGGSYSVAISGASTCSGSGVATVVVEEDKVSPLLSIASPSVLTCSVTSSTLQATVNTSPVTYLWSGPSSFSSTAQTATVTSPGTYSLVVTNPANGCTAAASVVVSQDVTAPASVTAVASGTLTCTTTSVTLTGSTTTSGVTYLWTGPGTITNATSAVATVSTAGTYTLQVTKTSTGCVTTTTVSVSQDVSAPASVTAVASGTLTCTTTSVTLTGSTTTSGVTYLWTGPGTITNSTSAVATVSTAGTYTLKVTKTSTGCFTTTTVAVSQDISVPDITASGSTLTCLTTVATLTGSTSTSGVTYLWTGAGTITNATSAVATTTTVGTYTLKITKTSNGCFSSATATVGQDVTPPAGVTASSSGVITCATTSVTLTGSSTTSGVQYSWTGPSGYTSSQQSPATTVSGSYTVTVLNPSNGCTSTASVSVSQNKTAPVVSIATPGVLTCATSSVVLSASSATSGLTYSWSGPGSFSSTLSSPEVSGSGSYTVVGTNLVNGCSGTASTTVSQDITLPNVSGSASGILTCVTPSVVLTGASTTSGVTYSWVGPGSFSSSSATPTVTVPGTYTLTVHSTANGCNATTSVTVGQNITIPSASASVSGTLTCGVTGVTLSGSSTTSGVSYNWTGPNNYASTEQNPVTSVGGAYTVTVTHPVSGCTSTASVTVNQNTSSPAALSASASGSITCTSSSVTLSASSTSSGVSYSWSGPNSFTSSVQNPVVTASGSYTVVATLAATGCTSSATVVVGLDMDPPASVTATTSGNITCTATSVTLTASSGSSGVTYSWTGPNSFTSTAASPVVSASGDYTVVVTKTSSGCQASASVTVGLDTTPPNASVSNTSGGIVLTCFISPLIFTGTSTTSGVSMVWTGPSGYVANGAVASVTVPGTYVFTVTAANGCFTTRNRTVSQTLVPPTVTASASGTITCSTPTVTLTGTSSGTPVTYSWTGPSGYTASVQNPVVTAGGTYNLTVTTPAGCTGTASVVVGENKTIPADVQTSVSNHLDCSFISATVSGSTSTSGVTYSWSGPSSFTSTQQSFQTALSGPYTLTVTHSASGCTTTATATVINDGCGD